MNSMNTPWRVERREHEECGPHIVIVDCKGQDVNECVEACDFVGGSHYAVPDMCAGYAEGIVAALNRQAAAEKLADLVARLTEQVYQYDYDCWDSVGKPGAYEPPDIIAEANAALAAYREAVK